MSALTLHVQPLNEAAQAEQEKGRAGNLPSWGATAAPGWKEGTEKGKKGWSSSGSLLMCWGNQAGSELGHSA